MANRAEKQAREILPLSVQDNIEPIMVIRLPAVKNTVGLSSATIYRLIKAGDFPPPIKLGRHASGWLLSAVQTWIRERAAQGRVGDPN